MGSSTFSGPVVSQAGFQTTTAAGVASAGFISGSGAPTLSAAKGTIYTNVAASTAATRVYVNTDGGTTWAAFTAAA